MHTSAPSRAIRSRFSPSVLLVAGLLVIAPPVLAVPLLVNGGFDTGTFRGWTAGSTQINSYQASLNDGLNSQIVNNAGGTAAWFMRNVPSSHFGTNDIQPITGYTAINGFDGNPGNFFLQQNFTLTGALTSATLQFDWATQTSYGGLARTFSVNILNTGGANLATVYSATPAFNSPFWLPAHVSLDLTGALNSLGAGTYQLQFLEMIPQNFTGPGSFGIDNISLEAAFAPPNTTGTPDGGTTVSLLGAALLVVGLARRSWVAV